jgi:hypothetical protein
MSKIVKALRLWRSYASTGGEVLGYFHCESHEAAREVATELNATFHPVDAVYLGETEDAVAIAVCPGELQCVPLLKSATAYFRQSGAAKLTAPERRALGIAE